MNMMDNLREDENALRSIVLRPDVLHLNPLVFRPPVLVGRDRELKLLQGMLNDFTSGKRSPQVRLVTGAKSIGKTITILRFMDLLNTKPEPRKVIGIYLRPENTLRESIESSHLPYFYGALIPRATNAALNLLFTKIETRHGKVSILLIIDDAQRYSASDLNDVLRYLFEYPQPVLVVLSFNISIQQMKARIEHDVQSRFALSIPVTISFHSYIFQEVYDILKQRAELALKPSSWNELALEEITKYTMGQGDLRAGIELLSRVAAATPEDKTLKPDDIKQAVATAGIGVWRDDFNNLDLLRRLYLLGTILAAHETSKPHERGVLLEKSERRYEMLCKTLDVSVVSSRTTRWQIRRQLEDMGLLKSEHRWYNVPTDSGPRRGSTTLLFLPDIPEFLLRAMAETEWGIYRDNAKFAEIIGRQTATTGKK